MLDGRTGGGEKRDTRGHKSKLLFSQHLSPTCTSVESASANVFFGGKKIRLSFINEGSKMLQDK